jgi:translation initiation factor 5A
MVLFRPKASKHHNIFKDSGNYGFLLLSEVFSMEVKQVEVTSVKKGSNIMIEGAPCRVVDTQISRPGKHGHAKVRVSAVGLIDDKKRVIVMPGHDKIDVPIINKRNAQVLSVQDSKANVMDGETYETFDIEIPDELKGEVSEGITIHYWVLAGQRIMKQVK